MFIIPPPEIKAIIEKTAAAVARMGMPFEQKIQENEKANQKFEFLGANHPYRPCMLLSNFSL